MIEEYFLTNLNSLMETEGLNQLRLSRELSIPQKTVNNWFIRKNIPNSESIEKLASYFKVEPHYFLMKPGSQGEAKPTERYDNFSSLMDELAEKNLDKKGFEEYKSAGGANTFVVLMRENKELRYTHGFNWYLKLVKVLNEYTSVNIMENLKDNLERASSDDKKRTIG